MLNVEFLSEITEDNTAIDCLVISTALTDDLITVQVSITIDGEMTVEVFNDMNKGEGVFVNQFLLGGG